MTDPYARLATERDNPRTRDLDLLPTRELVERVFAEDAAPPRACAAAAAAVARVADLAAAALARGGRVVYVGAGSSGRLAVLDAVELTPTFGVAPDRVPVLLAGGREAMFEAVEGAEDDADAGARGVHDLGVGAADLVLGVTASGCTPFVLGALGEARRLGAATAAVVCNPPAPGFPADQVAHLETGPEVLAGSTRMKAGTATKLALNAISLAAMVRLGKVYGNRMVDVRGGSRKLRDRARRLVAELGAVDAERAASLLDAAEGHAKLAILMSRTGLAAPAARARLDAAGGSLRRALGASAPGETTRSGPESPSRLVVGLMSGTSADGVDAALVRVTGEGPLTRVETLAFLTQPYPPEVRAAVLSLSGATAAEVCRWNFELGERFAEAALAVIARAGLTPKEVDLVGSHGQTIVHLPREAGRGAATLQIAEPAVIAERTGLRVVADFRTRDVAAGGEGAPLVPWVDWLLLRPAEGERLVQNLGGVGNVTLVTQDPEGVVAFDTGPANGPLDAAAALVSDGRLRFDQGGRLAAAGRADEEEVRALLAHPYFRRAPPKSLSRDAFGEAFVRDLARRRSDLSGPDLLATLTEFVARGVAAAYRDHLPPAARPRDVVVSGGGVHNPALMARLCELLAPLPVRSSAALGIDPDAKEAVAFAVLANEAVCDRPGNLPRATGARRPVVLGKLVP